ncbi:MAG: hypothetical protein ACP5II_06385 [Infirmifilum sp.]|jgi:hypothetical protein|uniref:hypothetical protein n=1 Tax=Infirmifilum TaxID=2856573 RepID=UPI0023539787
MSSVGVLEGFDAFRYVLSKAGCLHPFRASRIIALAELRYIEETNERLTNLIYVEGPGAFYVEGLKEPVEEDPCFKRRKPEKGHGCIEYLCSEPSIRENLRRYLDQAIMVASQLDDRALNEMVVKHPLYKKLFSRTTMSG